MVLVWLISAQAVVAGDTQADLPTPAERAWLDANPRILLGVGAEWAPWVIPVGEGRITGGLSWHAISHHESAGATVSGGNGSKESLVSRLRADDALQRAMKKSMHPGMVMIATDDPMHPDRRSGRDFVIVTSA